MWEAKKFLFWQNVEAKDKARKSFYLFYFILNKNKRTRAYEDQIIIKKLYRKITKDCNENNNSNKTTIRF